MAEGRILDSLEKIISQYSDAIIRSKEAKENIHRVTITSMESAASFTNGTSDALDIIFEDDSSMKEIFAKSNTKTEWGRQLARVFEGFLKKENVSVTGLNFLPDTPLTDFKGYMTSSKDPGNMYMKANSTRERFVIELRTPSTYRTIYKLCAHIKKIAWTNWVNDVKTGYRAGRGNQKLPPNVDLLKNTKANKALGEQVTFAHDKHYEIGLGRVKIVCDEIAKMGPDTDMYFIQESVKLENEIFNRVAIALNITPQYLMGILSGEKREVEGTLGPNVKSVGDFRYLKKHIMGEGEGSLRNWLKNNKRHIDLVDPERAMDYKGSRSFKQDAAASHARGAVDTIGTSLKKAGVKGKTVKTKAPLKKRPKRTVKHVHKAPSRTKINKGRVRAGSGKVWKIAGPKEKGSSETSLIELTRLKKKINKRLPAEVRRNMGRPALINQTGRFSNSTQLLNLRETAGGISGEYTYQRNPYQTFENTGSRKWPGGYNPKPLIAKSIRQLALQYTEQKLTSLRRI